jgi:hypothetical protein
MLFSELRRCHAGSFAEQPSEMALRCEAEIDCNMSQWSRIASEHFQGRCQPPLDDKSMQAHAYGLPELLREMAR